MEKHGPSLFAAALVAALVVLATAGTGFAAPTLSTTPSSRAEVTQERGASIQLAGERELEPRYEASEPRHHHNSYNDEYVFGLTRGVADSTMHPAVKILVFPVTVPLDFVLLPFEVIGGFF